jgi:hypothetical protein
MATKLPAMILGRPIQEYIDKSEEIAPDIEWLFEDTQLHFSSAEDFLRQLLNLESSMSPAEQGIIAHFLGDRMLARPSRQTIREVAKTQRYYYQADSEVVSQAEESNDDLPGTEHEQFQVVIDHADAGPGHEEAKIEEEDYAKYQSGNDGLGPDDGRVNTDGFLRDVFAQERLSTLG